MLGMEVRTVRRPRAPPDAAFFNNAVTAVDVTGLDSSKNYKGSAPATVARDLPKLEGSPLERGSALRVSTPLLPSR